MGTGLAPELGGGADRGDAGATTRGAVDSGAEATLGRGGICSAVLGTTDNDSDGCSVDGVP